jgi:hypothetical protein
VVPAYPSPSPASGSGPVRRRFCRPSGGDGRGRVRCIGSGWREDWGQSMMVVQKERWRFQATDSIQPIQHTDYTTGQAHCTVVGMEIIQTITD